VEGVDPETWYGRVATSVAEQIGGRGGKEEKEAGRGDHRKVVDLRKGTNGEEKRDLQERQSQWERRGEYRTSQWSEG